MAEITDSRVSLFRPRGPVRVLRAISAEVIVFLLFSEGFNTPPEATAGYMTPLRASQRFSAPSHAERVSHDASNRVRMMVLVA